MKITQSLQKNKQALSQLQNSDDIVFLDLNIGKSTALLIFAKEIVDKDALGQLVLRPALSLEGQVDKDTLWDCFLNPEKQKVFESEQVIDQVLSGFALLLCDGVDFAVSFGVQKYEKRAIAEPPTSTVINKDMNITADVEMTDGENGEKRITVSGESAAILIGHHGDTLDSLQYLANLAANKRVDGKKEPYVKITVDVEGYRAKREETLRALARRMAAKVQKYKKSVMLEPMNPYERRIIHSEIQNIEGVSTNSIGSENNRKIVIFLETEEN